MYSPESGECVEFTATELVEAKTLCDFKKELDITLGAKGIRDMGGRGIRILNLMLSHEHNEWRSRFEGPNGLLLVLFSMFLYVMGKELDSSL